jgi:hypothetical protein
MVATKGNGLDAANDQPAKTHTKHTADITPARFIGTDNPRHLRVIPALLTRPRRRADLDDISGQQNSPELVAELRRRGLEIPCERIQFIDRDGHVCRPGVYSLTTKDRSLIWAWQARIKEGNSVQRS